MLERISISKYQPHFILKGGFLIAAMVGLDTRAGDEYSGYRISLTANYPPMAVPLKLDITTGDKITPKEIMYGFKLLLEDRTIKILAYKFTIVS